MAIQNFSMQEMKTFLSNPYYIPDYQREYAWEENEIGDFWDDLELTRKEPGSEHFFGQIVVHNAEDEEGRKYIIDGQQRTLTSMIFVRTLQAAFEKLAGTSTDSAIRKKCMKRSTLLSCSYLGDLDDDIENVHLFLNRADHAYFLQHILLGEPSQEKERKTSQENMRYAYRSFTQNFEAVLADSALKTLKARTFYPVVLAMELAGRFTEDDIAAVLNVIESYTFRNATICGLTANKTEKMLSRVALQIYNAEFTNVADIAAEIRKTMVKDDAFADAFERWSSKTKDIIRYILRKINAYLDPDLEINLDNSEVHIEHIMPENGDLWKHISPEEHDEYLWRLGNLTLMSGRKNRKASNMVFESKTPMYLDSKIQLTINVAKNYTDWDIQSIEARQKAMCECALKIWR